MRRRGVKEKRIRERLKRMRYMEGILKGRKKEILNSVSTLERGKSEEEGGG